MLKSVLRVVLNILSVIVLFLLQLYVFNNIYIFGARFNIIAVYIIIFAMINSLKLSLPVSLLIGLTTDIVLGNGKLQYMLIFMIVSVVLESLKLIYKQDSSMSILVYGAAGFIVLESISQMFWAISSGILLNVLVYIFHIIKILLLNIPVAYLMYYLVVKVNEKLER